MLRGLAGVVLAIAVIAVGVSGCGGDDDSLTRAEYRRQVNAICAEGNSQKNEAIAEAYEDPKKAGITGEGEKASLELLNELALPPIITMTEELASLGGPSGEEEKAEELVAAFEAELEEIEANQKEAIDASSASAEFKEANDIAAELGLKSCLEI